MQPTPESLVHRSGLKPPGRPVLDGQFTGALSLELGDLRAFFGPMQQLFRHYSADEIGAHARFEKLLPDGRSKNYYMPACIGEYEAEKTIYSRPENLTRGLERSQSTIKIADHRTGVHLCTVSGNEVTPVKTALTTAVALDAWMKTALPDKLRIGVIGGGPLARGHIAACYQLFGEQIESVRACSRESSAEKMVREISARYPCEAAPKKEILEGSNVILLCTATTPDKPALTSDEINIAGRTIFMAGIGFNDICVSLFPRATMLFSEDPVSYSKSQMMLAQFLRMETGQRLASLSDVVSGKERTPAEGLTIFLPYGTAMTDLAVCLKALNIDPARSAVQYQP